MINSKKEYIEDTNTVFHQKLDIVIPSGMNVYSK